MGHALRLQPGKWITMGAAGEAANPYRCLLASSFRHHKKSTGTSGAASGLLGLEFPFTSFGTRDRWAWPWAIIICLCFSEQVLQPQCLRWTSACMCVIAVSWLWNKKTIPHLTWRHITMCFTSHADLKKPQRLLEKLHFLVTYHLLEGIIEGKIWGFWELPMGAVFSKCIKGSMWMRAGGVS